MATDSSGMGIPLPPDATPVHQFPGITRNAVEAIAAILAGGLTPGIEASVEAAAASATEAAIADAGLVRAEPLDAASPYAMRVLVEDPATGIRYTKFAVSKTGAVEAAGLAPAKPRPAAKTNPTFVLMGDSITDQTSLLGGDADPGAAAATVRRFDMVGYFTWAQLNLGHKIILKREAGITGQGVTTMQNRFDADVVNVAADVLVLFAGINSIGSMTSQQIQDALKDMAERAIESGKTVVLCTLLCNSLNGIDIDPATSQPYTDRTKRLDAVNSWIRSYAAQREGVVLCDWRYEFVDPATGRPKAGLGFDSTHPNANGASFLGAYLAKVLAPLVAANSSAGLIETGAEPRLVTRNPRMTGTAGVRGAGTGQIADNWNGTQGQTGGGTPYTGSIAFAKTTRTGGGSWQQIKLTTAGGVWFYQSISAATLAGLGSTFVESDGAGGYRYKAGKKLRAEFEYERDNDWVKPRLLYAGLEFNTGVKAEDLANANLIDAGPSSIPLTGVMRTPYVTTPASATNLILAVRFSADAGTIRLDRGAVVEVP